MHHRHRSFSCSTSEKDSRCVTGRGYVAGRVAAWDLVPVCTTLAPLERPILTCLESFYGRAVDLNLTWIMHRASAARFQSRIRTSVRSSEEWPTTVQRSKLIANWNHANANAATRLLGRSSSPGSMCNDHAGKLQRKLVHQRHTDRSRSAGHN